ncbi:acid phosphatase PHO1 [Pyricularia oryzae 70-15]|uniref:Acid phosphatase PHO1 n=3 Tax=Pyricularia oryzae TaxID=318829 RepID=G4NBV8_PYRO7|nr:acid phosphatase PHO1 [Pyricularia oryzae 70-15]EHA48160.1 acid phosphatase PHO1 [Pyricularia oryzae 70-15]ELQ44006.1 acid phosphatase PHO1 [Pyricularia oryzae Y34]KAI7914183.1 acid phosphatase PHO1 [Pyricularia oryzae]KAI7916133.1 acid phosphatase PHO1 [Pyricularia oryzae]
MKLVTASSLCAILAAGVHAQRGASLDPIQPVLLPDGANAKNPLSHLGGNGPWTVAPNVNGISSDVPENCHVDQAAYILRHGSRYADPGAHSGWVTMANQFKTQNYTATGPIAFFHDWDTPLTHPDIQIAQLSPTGYKELYSLGYTLRTRYPDLYEEGDDFYVWANKYPRVIQTAQLFVRGFLGSNSTRLGNVVSVDSKGFPDQLGNTLAPSDLCPSFEDNYSPKSDPWRNIWLPRFKARLAQYIEGDLQIDDGAWNDIPYICGFESQITGRLSPFCDVFNDEELAQYEYQQDLRYYYGHGPGAFVASRMMVPFLNALVNRLVEGPSADVGVGPDGSSSFKVPKLLMNFLNDGQLNQLAAALGVFDEQEPLPSDHIPEDRLWRSSRISPMRGTIALERLNCRVGGSGGGNSTLPPKPTPSGGPCKAKKRDAASTMQRRQDAVIGGPSRNETFVRIRINEAVYPVPSCQDGPGKSCRLADYAKYVSDKLEAIGSFSKLCNATAPGTPADVKGASFLTNLDQDHLEMLKP